MTPAHPCPDCRHAIACASGARLACLATARRAEQATAKRAGAVAKVE